MSSLIRSFVAVNLPGKIADEIEDFISKELRPLAKIRWVTRPQLHITLKFIGEQTQNKTDEIKKSIIPLKNFEPFEIELSHAGAFPNFRNPRVLWLSGKKGIQELSKIAMLVDENIFKFTGIPKDEKNFKAHLTLARLKGESLNEKLLKKLENIPTFKWTCKELFLMRSELTPNGPIYSKII